MIKNKKVLLAFAFFLCLPSCQPDEALPTPGTLYEITLSDGSGTGVARFEKQDSRELAGTFYADKGQLYAEARPVTVKVGNKGCRIVLDDGVERKFSFRPYTEPEFPELSEKTLYREPLYPVVVEKDVIYGNEKGYWTSYPREDGLPFKDVFLNRQPAVFSGMKPCPLTMDVYLPEGAGVKPRPLFVLIHGGAFYYQDKADPECERWCRHFAERGYVAASINYRMGFRLIKEETTRAGYRALQDAHAAVRFLVGKSEWHVDPDRVFLAGSSAGAITALNLVFMQNDNRPDQTKGGLITGFINNLFGTTIRDMGPIDAVNPDDSTQFTVRAVCNMWGAVPNLKMLDNSETAVISFHSEYDPTVPFGYDYPFRDKVREVLFKTSDLDEGSMKGVVAEKVNDIVFDKMYGSKYIDQALRDRGRHSALYRYTEPQHCVYQDENEKIIAARLDEIIQRTEVFFSREMEPHPVHACLIGEYGPWIRIDRTAVKKAFWQVDGGVLREITPDSVRILVFPDAEKHTVRVAGEYNSSMTFSEDLTL